MKLISSIQQKISKSKSIDDIVYIENLKTGLKSNLSNKLNINYWNYIQEPLNNSNIKKTNDLTNVIKLANNRNSKETKLVYLVDDDPFKLFIPIIEKHSLVFPFLEFTQIYQFLHPIITDLKYFFNKPRPKQLANYYNLDINVIHTKTHKTPSYPSGHTAYASLIAAILTKKYPEYSNKFWDAVNLCGQARILQGVHFQEDNLASIEFVKKVYTPLYNFNLNF